MHTISALKLTLLLAPLAIALSLAMDVYVPAIPSMTQLFAVSDKVMLLTLNLFMLSCGVMQIVVGPLSDAYGRKPIAYLMIFFFSLGSLLCGLAPDPYFLIGARIIQALGSCGMLVIGFTIVRDCFKGRESAKVYSYLNGFIAVSPMFAPFLGSFLDLHFGWRSTFLCLLIISVISTISMYLLPETLAPEEKDEINFHAIISHYRSIFFNKTFAIYNLATCFGLSYLYLFCALSPYLIIRDLAIPEHEYGYYFFYMGLSFFLGSLVCSLLVERLGVYKMCMLGFFITACGGVWMGLWYNQNGLTLHGFIYPMLLIGIGGTFCMGAGNGGAMRPFDHHTGSAAALGGTLRFLFSSLVGYIVISEEVASTLPLGIPAIIFSITGLVLFSYFKSDLLNRTK